MRCSGPNHYSELSDGLGWAEGLCIFFPTIKENTKRRILDQLGITL